MHKAVIAGLAGTVLSTACGDSPAGGNGENYFAPMVRPADFAQLTGDDWEGKLTYRSHGEPQEEVTIPAELAVSQNANTFELYISYPDEPRADGRAELTVSADGRMINDEKVISRSKDDGQLVLETEAACEDNGAPAQCAYIYTIAPDVFSFAKMVTPEGADEAFQQNRYSFTR